jgi:hypothetical protein
MGDMKILNRRHVERHALKAISQRLWPPGEYPAEHALLGIERDGSSLLVHVNSGGNELAVEQYLRQLGYRAEYVPNPGGYGCAVRVSVGGAA